MRKESQNEIAKQGHVMDKTNNWSLEWVFFTFWKRERARVMGSLEEPLLVIVLHLFKVVQENRRKKR